MVNVESKLYKGPKILVEEQACRNVFNNYLAEYKNFDKPEIERLSEYEINKIEVKKEKSDKTEFVYKNRLNINSKNPNYQIDKYGSYKYLDEMRNLLKEME